MVQLQLNYKYYFKKIIFIILKYLFFLFNVKSALGEEIIKNGFVIKNYTSILKKQSSLGPCSISLSYPELHNDDLVISENINREIINFTKNYNFCNGNDIIVKYEIMQSNPDYFSIRWNSFKKNNQLIRIDTLTFDLKEGNIILFNQIINPLAHNFIHEIIKLSKNHLAKDINWEQFLEKIKEKDVQFYFSDSKWHIIFNPNFLADNILDIFLPEYLLRDQ